jgi:hypothetical protein
MQETESICELNNGNKHSHSELNQTDTGKEKVESDVKTERKL